MSKLFSISTQFFYLHRVKCQKTVLFQTIQFIMCSHFKCQKQFYFKQFSLEQVHNFNIKTVLFQTIQFSISTLFSSIWSIDKTLSGAITPGQRGPGSNGNEGLLHCSI